MKPKIFICQISGKISRLEIHSFRKIIRLYGLHQIVRHFRRTVYRHMFKADASASMYHKVAGLGVIIVAVAPCAGFSGTVAYLCVHIRIK